MLHREVGTPGTSRSPRTEGPCGFIFSCYPIYSLTGAPVLSHLTCISDPCRSLRRLPAQLCLRRIKAFIPTRYTRYVRFLNSGTHNESIHAKQNPDKPFYCHFKYSCLVPAGRPLPRCIKNAVEAPALFPIAHTYCPCYRINLTIEESSLGFHLYSTGIP